MEAKNFFFLDVHELVRLIPKGRVTSYGAIARYLGTGQSARMVGWAMNASHTAYPAVPAHRVVNRNGLLSGKHHFGDPEAMQKLLESEGVKVKEDQIQEFEAKFWDPYERTFFGLMIMGLITEIKAGNISNLTDARYFSSFGVRWLGFNFDPLSPGYVSPELVKEMIPWIYGPEIIAEFSKQDPENMHNILSFLGLRLIQLPLSVPSSIFKDSGMRICREVAFTSSHTGSQMLQIVREQSKDCELIVLKFEMSWEELKGNKGWLSSLKQLQNDGVKCLLDALWKPDDFPEVTQILPGFGLNIKGSTEQKTGIKLFEELDGIMQKLDTET